MMSESSPASLLQQAVEQLERLQLDGGQSRNEDNAAATAAAGTTTSSSADWEEIAEAAEQCANSLRTGRLECSDCHSICGAVLLMLSILRPM